ncbi:MAG TPA: hypothetical protein VFD13_05160 [Candidatus Kapabacteria bacterium]|nr:hypothetical protein [Candidatus Kapabacteria bacterium]
MCFVSLTGVLRAQTNTYGPPGQNWPDNPPVGIGTVGSGSPQNALQIHHSIAPTWPAILRLSDGATDSTNIYGALALMPDTSPAFDSAWSSLATQHDLVLHEHVGDLILADFDPQPAAIRMSTTPDPTTLPPAGPPPYTDLERETILSNGNIGFDLPPDPTTGLGTPLDQIQIGGGSIAPPGYSAPIPGLTIYGGNRFEGMMRSDTAARFPVDWRTILFNHYEDHRTGYTSRFAPMAASGIEFSDFDSGLVQLDAWPLDTAHSLTDFNHEVTLQLTGQQGLTLFTADSGKYHALFDVWKRGYTPWPVTRNVNGLFFHHTPVFIGTDTGANFSPDFTNLHGLYPDIGDDSTWMLAVSGAVLAKEIFVLDSAWADYVFDPGYKLMTIENFGKFMIANHHLPEIPDAKTMEKGVPVGRTEEAITKQIEEMALYIVQLNKDVESLKAEVQELKNHQEK